MVSIDGNPTTQLRSWFLAASTRIKPVYPWCDPGYEHRYLGAAELRTVGGHYGADRL